MRRADFPKILGALCLIGVLVGSSFLFAGKAVLVPAQSPGLTGLPVVEVRRNPSADSIYEIKVTDDRPLANLELYVDSRRATFLDWSRDSVGNTWSWRWQIKSAQPDDLRFYHACNDGCLLWHSRRILTSATDGVRAPRVPTKLGVAFADPERNWQGKSGWNVELVYALTNDKDYWGIDLLAERVLISHAKGLRTLVRVDYDRGQTVPGNDDLSGLSSYLTFLRRIARDVRFATLEGIIIGSGPNDNGSNSKAPDRKVTPEWYARMFNGYGTPADNNDNIVQAVRGLNERLKVFVGPIRPWNTNQNGLKPYTIDVPWLNYMNTLVAALDRSARHKSEAGAVFVQPDGFALQVPGRPDAVELADKDRALEPKLEITRPQWAGAQMGFRIYQDWLNVINAYPTTRGLPVVFSSVNTFTPDDKINPTKNYPRGWLPNALNVINNEPQVLALCWFMDGIPGDNAWDGFSLLRGTENMDAAAKDFEELLKQK